MLATPAPSSASLRPPPTIIPKHAGSSVYEPPEGRAVPGDKLEATLRALGRRIAGSVRRFAGSDAVQEPEGGEVAEARVEAARELGRWLGEDAGEAFRDARRVALSAGVVAALVGLLRDDERLEAQVRASLSHRHALLGL